MIPIESSTVRNCLPVAWISSSRPTQARQDQSTLAGNQVGSVQLGRYMGREPAALHGVCTIYRIRGVREEVAADRKNTLTSPSNMACMRLHRIVSGLARRLKVELLPQGIEKSLGGRSQIPIVRSPCTFECPRTRQVPAPGRPMLPPTSSRFTIIGRCRPVVLLGDAHSTRQKMVFLGVRLHLGRRADLGRRARSPPGSPSRTGRRRMSACRFIEALRRTSE